MRGGQVGRIINHHIRPSAGIEHRRERLLDRCSVVAESHGGRGYLSLVVTIDKAGRRRNLAAGFVHHHRDCPRCVFGVLDHLGREADRQSSVARGESRHVDHPSVLKSAGQWNLAEDRGQRAVAVKSRPEVAVGVVCQRPAARIGGVASVGDRHNRSHVGCACGDDRPARFVAQRYRDRVFKIVVCRPLREGEVSRNRPALRADHGEHVRRTGIKQVWVDRAAIQAGPDRIAGRRKVPRGDVDRHLVSGGARSARRPEHHQHRRQHQNCREPDPAFPVPFLSRQGLDTTFCQHVFHGRGLDSGQLTKPSLSVKKNPQERANPGFSIPRPA